MSKACSNDASLGQGPTYCIKTELALATAALTPVSSSARLDSELLLSKIIHQSRTFFYTHPEYTLTALEHDTFQQLLAQRLTGMPIAYLIGTREFWSLPLDVTTDTLIPRPDTERLVELALSLLPETSHANILDLGTGTGAIALALASERPSWTLLACDKSQAAVNTARANATQLGIKNLNVLCSNWFNSIPKQRFDAIVSNPPYIAENDPHLLQGDVRFEPRDALVSGVDGLDALLYIIERSRDWLLPGGFIALEHGFEQGPAVTAALKQFGYQHVKCWQDWQGNDRVSIGQAKSQ